MLFLFRFNTIFCNRMDTLVFKITAKKIVLKIITLIYFSLVSIERKQHKLN